MRVISIVFSLIFIFQSLLAQTLSIKKFIPLNFIADDFSINENRNNIFLISRGSNEIVKINLDGKVLKKIGGFGWNDGQFDIPSSIVSTAIDIYVADFNNHRIQRFDQNLNFISSLEKSESVYFEYPASIALSTKGDLYILDSKNKKVLKINGFSKLERTFGNYESGKIVLSEPRLIKLDQSQLIYILDKDQIIVYDEFGSFIKTIPVPEELKGNIVDFQVFQNSIFFLTGNGLYEFKDELRKLFIDDEIIDKERFIKLEIRLGKFYLLTEKGILICEKEN
jgi:hypothetical protein